MISFVTRFRTGRFAWTVLVAGYFLVFFRNLLQDAMPSGSLLPLAFAVALVLWLATEYYFGSPFFQSGVVEHSAFWRGVFAFLVYPMLGYAAADFIWWRWTQIPVPTGLAGVVGLALFGLGTFLRLATLFDLLRIVQVKPSARMKAGPAADQLVVSEKRFVALRFQRLVRHPRYLGTLVQLFGAVILFRSWGALLALLLLGVPVVLRQVCYEDVRLHSLLKGELKDYKSTVPRLWPRCRSCSDGGSRKSCCGP
jgi:protein-S-isoprenylcysteine O-methyltransferase Ste14